MTAILALARKDLTLLLRNKGHLFFSFAWPLLVAFVFGLLFAGPPQGSGTLQLAVVDEDASEGSAALIGRLGKTEGLQVTPLPRDEAMQRVRRGRLVAVLIVPKGYGVAADRMFYGTPPTLTIAVDPSRRAESAMLEGILTGAAMQGVERRFTDKDYSQRMVDDAMRDLRASPPGEVQGRTELERFLGELRAFVTSPATQPGGAGGQTGTGGWQPLIIEKTDVVVQHSGPRNSFMITFPQGALWGMIGCAFGFALSLVIERTRGTLMRLQVAPLRRGHVLAGKGLACFAAIVLVEVLLFGIARAFLGVVPGSVPLLALACLSLAVAFVGIMMMISTLGKTEETVGGIAWAILLPMSMFGGGMVPLFAMPPWMLTASNFSPVKWGILALEGALWRGFTLQEMLLPCGILVAVGVVGFAVGARLFRA